MSAIIAKKLKEYCGQYSKSYNDIVTEIKNRNFGDISTATLSNMVTGKWDKISNLMWTKVASYLGMNIGWQIIRTKVFEEIHKTCQAAQNFSEIKMVVGNSGIGKTTTYERYQQESNNVYIVTCATEMNKKEFIGAIAEALGLDGRGTKFQMVRKIADKVQALQSPLIILDEAGKLPTAYLSVVQVIYEFSGKHCGFVLSGVSYLYDNLMKATERHKAGMPELEGRINAYLAFSNKTAMPTMHEKKAIAELNGVKTEDIDTFIRQQGIESYRDLYHAVQHYLRNEALTAGPKSDN
jgi:hypothetical protein